ncbi:hypothetical protein PRZ48_013549 [Zasmidium cellare]|uniref:Uncharacterized protein n=1 Tax=Zasmidium cellare TaxID=395010 RepID=A0ABR0E1R0_ZASCE|nr:hypothetical protein PRZ48_013549 [Zasmidium cellare]
MILNTLFIFAAALAPLTIAQSNNVTITGYVGTSCMGEEEYTAVATTDCQNAKDTIGDETESLDIEGTFAPGFALYLYGDDACADFISSEGKGGVCYLPDLEQYPDGPLSYKLVDTTA